MGLNNVNIDPKIMKRTEAIVLSMTLEERRDPSILKASRKRESQMVLVLLLLMLISYLISLKR